MDSIERIERMDEGLFDSLILSDDELLFIKGGTDINCGAGCGLGCGGGCGSECSGCTTSKPETTLC